MDVATLGAIGTIAVGLATAAGAAYGKRGENRNAAASGAVTGYGQLVNDLQEERDALRQRLADTEQRLIEAYRDLADARAEKSELLSQIHELTGERQRLREQIARLGGTP
ncbi:hypothetical protein [Streptomyces sp. NPDC058045]|uniref:hypothetical protein n=1 Tax=Streptomyces sp. NPDC058045 TaxID=3346311 RepID=UPI0036EA4C82